MVFQSFSLDVLWMISKILTIKKAVVTIPKMFLQLALKTTPATQGKKCSRGLLNTPSCTATSLFMLLAIARHGDALFSFPSLNDLQHSHLKRTVVTISTDAKVSLASNMCACAVVERSETPNSCDVRRRLFCTNIDSWQSICKYIQRNTQKVSLALFKCSYEATRTASSDCAACGIGFRSVVCRIWSWTTIHSMWVYVLVCSCNVTRQEYLHTVNSLDTKLAFKVGRGMLRTIYGRHSHFDLHMFVSYQFQFCLLRR